MAAVTPLSGDELETTLRRTAGPVALDFYQASCPPCRVLEPRRERIAQQYAGRLPVYRVDIDRGLAAARRFKVTSLPTVLVLHDGKEVERLDGLITDGQPTQAFERAAQVADQSGA